jgi:excisionase family DNA binding protein
VARLCAHIDVRRLIALNISDLLVVPTEDAARILHVSETTLLRLVRDGELHPKDVGRGSRIRYRFALIGSVRSVAPCLSRASWSAARTPR